MDTEVTNESQENSPKTMSDRYHPFPAASKESISNLPQRELGMGDSTSSHLVPGECTVVLNRMALEGDGEEKDDLRKKGKNTSRIPTFQSALARKRPPGHGAEVLASFLARKETSGPPTEKSDSGQALQSKFPSCKETTLLPPSAHLPSDNTNTPSDVGDTEATPTSVEPKIYPLKLNQPSDNNILLAETSMSVDLRPALRPESESHDPDSTKETLTVLPESKSGRLHNNAQVKSRADLPTQIGIGALQTVLATDLIPSSKEKLESSEIVKNQKMLLNLIDKEGQTDTSPFDIVEKTTEDEEDSQSIELMKVGKTKVPVQGHYKENLGRSEDPGGNQEQSSDEEDISGNVSRIQEKAVKEEHSVNGAELMHHRTKKSHQSAAIKKTWCRSFVLFCLFPSTVLLLGGIGQHIMRYGTPTSVSHLMAQLELDWLDGFWGAHEPCSSDCRIDLVESIPEGLYPSDTISLPSISQTWTSLLIRANSSVNIAAFYLTLRDTDQGLSEPSARQGKQVFEQLMQLQSKGVQLKIAVNGPQSNTHDTEELTTTGAEVQEVNLQSITGGIVHTKLWVVDQKHLYVGSANMDWRSLTQVKEVGVTVENCSCLVSDASRIFDVYWYIGQKNGSLPLHLPPRLSALSSAERPLLLKLNGVPARVYLSSAPPALSAYGRSDDLSAILSVISDAERFVFVSVMDYLPTSEFTKPLRFWPDIDSAIREAACARGVEVNLLVSCWEHSSPAMFVFLQSLTVLNTPPLGCNIHVKVFEVPSTPQQKAIPFARVNHAKYMVTDRVAYIGTSNWSENYFTQTAGVGLVVNHTGFVVGKGHKTVQSQLKEIFLRDWTSLYAKALSNEHSERCGIRA